MTNIKQIHHILR